jgi:hypothetical protein
MKIVFIIKKTDIFLEAIGVDRASRTRGTPRILYTVN